MKKENTSKKMNKKDHEGTKKAAKVAKGAIAVAGMLVALVPGMKFLSNIGKKS